MSVLPNYLVPRVLVTLTLVQWRNGQQGPLGVSDPPSQAIRPPKGNKNSGNENGVLLENRALYLNRRVIISSI